MTKMLGMCALIGSRQQPRYINGPSAIYARQVAVTEMHAKGGLAKKFMFLHHK